MPKVKMHLLDWLCKWQCRTVPVILTKFMSLWRIEQLTICRASVQYYSSQSAASDAGQEHKHKHKKSRDRWPKMKVQVRVKTPAKRDQPEIK